jgi:hypothetical protein
MPRLTLPHTLRPARLLAAAILSIGLVVAAPGAGSPADAHAPKAKGTTNVLVVQLYWKGTTPTDTTDYLQQVITGPNAWFRTVSHGAYGITGTVTPPLAAKRVRCSVQNRSTSKMAREATKAAAHAGFKPRHYQRLVVVVPCTVKKYVGWGQEPGHTVWLFNVPPAQTVTPPAKPAGTTETSSVTKVGPATFYKWTFTWPNGGYEWHTAATLNADPVGRAVHEMGHNLGLDHAHLLRCRKNGVAVSFGGRCTSIEYGDPYDTMSSTAVAGSFSAYRLLRLHWLDGKVANAKKRQRSFRIAPLEGVGGVKTVKIKGHHRTYWVEYRTNQGVDAPFDPAQLGVLIRYTKPRSQATWLVDAMPGSGRAWDLNKQVYGLTDADQSELLPGHTLTTPEGIKITTVAQDGGGATVQVTRPGHHRKHHQHRH